MPTQLSSFEIVSISTGGDRSQVTNQPSADWGTGVFVKELEAALLREEVDAAVHSLKDVPPIVTQGLTLAAIPVREDPLDVLVTPTDVAWTLSRLAQGSAPAALAVRHFFARRVPTCTLSPSEATSRLVCAS